MLARSITGNLASGLRNAFTDVLGHAGCARAAASHSLAWVRRPARRARAFLTTPVGQIVGDMTEKTSVRQVFYDMLNELLESKVRLDKLLS